MSARVRPARPAGRGLRAFFSLAASAALRAPISTLLAMVVISLFYFMVTRSTGAGG